MQWNYNCDTCNVLAELAKAALEDQWGETPLQSLHGNMLGLVTLN